MFYLKTVTIKICQTLNNVLTNENTTTFRVYTKHTAYNVFKKLKGTVKYQFSLIVYSTVCKKNKN